MKFLVVGIDYFTTNGGKRNLWQSLLSRMSKASSERTTFVVLGSLGYLFKIMEDSSTTYHLGNFVSSLGSGITTPHPPALSLMDKQKLQTDPC